MKMWGIFQTVRGSMTDDERRVKQEEVDQDPLALFKYADTAAETIKKYDQGAVEVREVEVRSFDIIIRRRVGA